MNIVAMRLLLAIIIFSLFSVTITCLHIPGEMKILLMGVALWVFPQAIYGDFAFQGPEKMQYVAVGKSLIQSIFLLSVLFFIKGSADLTTVPLLRFGSEFISGIFLLIFFFVLIGKWTFKDLKIASWYAHLKEAWVIAASLILNNIYYTFDTLLLGFLNKAEVVGWYNAAYKMIMLFVGVASLLQMAFAPFFASQKENRELFKKGMASFSIILIFLSALVCGTLFLGSNEIIHLLYGDDYQPSASILRLLSMSLFFIYLDTIFLSPLLFTGFQKYYLKASLIGAVSNIILNLILIQKWSYTGAAIATISSNFIIAVVGAFYFAKQFYFDFNLLKKIVAGTVLLAGIIFILSLLQVRPILAIALFVVSFSTLFFIQQKSDIEYIIKNLRL
jgi:O-antigen/teichoic acid export membrane protein